MQFFKSMNIIRCVCMESAQKRTILFEMSPRELTPNQLTQTSLSDQFGRAQVVGWDLLAAVTCLTVVGCSLFWAGVVDPTEIDELHIFRRQDRLSTDILSTAVCSQKLRRQIFCRKILEDTLLMFKSNNLPFIDLTKRMFGCLCGCGSEC